jgi:hypothetical protein
MADEPARNDQTHPRPQTASLSSTEGDFTVRLALEGERRLFAKIEEVAVPVVHFDDAPAADKDLGEAGNLGYQPASAISLGSRTRL